MADVTVTKPPIAEMSRSNGAFPPDSCRYLDISAEVWQEYAINVELSTNPTNPTSSCGPRRGVER